MSKEIRELEENSKRIIENMRPQTIAQYHIKQWLDDNFIMGCARLEYTGKDTAKVMDTVGGVMYVEYKNGEVPEMGCYICITDVQKSIDKISGQAKQGQYII